MSDIRFTTKQIEILEAIKKGNPDGSMVSVYDILDRVSYDCKRDAMLHSIRRLVENGYVERRDLVNKGKKTNIRVFSITTKALDYI